METKDKTLKNTHHGHAIKRIRRTLGVKQEALAGDLGLSQAQISTYEHKKVIDDGMIEKFAKALNVAPEFIEELEEDPVTVIIENNTFEKGSAAGINTINNNPDPIDRIIELSNEKTALYERMLELEKEKSTLLEKLLKERK
ncbi:transcriptional regulator [Prolixibacter bellariivorans]|uniref:Transcriptional regulator n=1 Tax=Prolixibacter bellariivorans TaxID=314319 RepID=A0A5M4B565_9BACT|nr:helix-turn-helix transcriptional regulator [Prolixibacter bellariivorans]GET35230.1 transcriptional regulator [Prolixibacter bellariivorans]